MSRFKGYFALIIFLFCILINYESSFANEDINATEGETNAAEGHGGGYYATSADCSSGLTEILIAIVAAKQLAVPLISSIISCVVNFSSGNFTGAQIDGFKIGGYVAAITLIFSSMSTSLQCLFAFVRDPILRDPGNKKPLKNDKTEAVNRWEAEKIPFSDIVEVCARPAIPYIPVISVLPNGLTPRDFSCYKTKQKDYFKGKDSSYYESNEESGLMHYDGINAFLCPEEWRVHGYSRGKDNAAYIVNQENIKTASLLDAKQNDGPLKCETHKLGDGTFTLHGYKYQIIKRGAKLCAQLMSLGSLPSASGKFIVGCHYGPPDPPAPLCANSEPVYLTEKDNNGLNKFYPATEALVRAAYPNTVNPALYVGKPIYAKNCEDNQNLDSCTNLIFDWDNNKCFSCYVNESCYSKSAMHARSTFPVTSYIMECITSSLQAVMFGCKGSVTDTGINTPGMFYILNKNLAYISYILITLAIALFAIKMLFAGHIPKLQEVMALVFKIAIVLFFMHGDSEKQGMMWLYKQMTSLSGGLSKIMLDAGNANGSCVFRDNLYDSTATENYLYLKPFDILDCKAFFYLGGKLMREDQVTSTTISKNLALKLIEIVFPLIFLFDPVALLVGIFLFFFAILIIALIIWIISLVVLSTIFVFLLVLLSPIIVPMILFDYTKGFFDAWIKELLAYMLFPVFIYLFFSLMVITLDKPMFGVTEFVDTHKGLTIGKNPSSYFAYKKKDCKAQYDRVTVNLNNKEDINDAINNPANGIDKACRYCLTVTSLNKISEVCDGCDLKGLACNLRSWNVKSSTTFLGGINTLKPENRTSVFLDLLESCGYILVIILIFLTLLKAITLIVGKLVGGSQTLRKIAAHGVDPLGSVTKMTKYAMTPVKATVKKAVNVAKGIGKKNRGKNK